MTKIFYALMLAFAGVTAANATETPMQTLQKLVSAQDTKTTVDLNENLPTPTPQAQAQTQEPDKYFNAYVLKAVDELYKKYGLLGYDIHSILTHNIPYGSYGQIIARNPPLTMCVAAQMEVILTAYEIYARETGDTSIYDFLPKRSYEQLTINDIKGHIWVNHDFNSNGTADALINFGMGERFTFENLKPGSFVNINRTTRTGHAVTFIGYVDRTGEIVPEYNSSVIGFRYFSSQGSRTPGEGGLGYYNAIFSKFGCPEMDFQRDCDVIYSTRQDYLNTGMMLSPKYWKHPEKMTFNQNLPDTVLNEEYFNGKVTDKPKK